MADSLSEPEVDGQLGSGGPFSFAECSSPNNSLRILIKRANEPSA